MIPSIMNIHPCVILVITIRMSLPIIPSIMNIHPCVILVITIRMSLPIITSIMNNLKVTSCGFFFGLK